MPRLCFVVGLGIGFGFEFGWCTVSCAWFVSKLLVNAWAYWLKVKCSRDCSTCVREMTDRMNSCCPWFVSIWGCCEHMRMLSKLPWKHALHAEISFFFLPSVVTVGEQPAGIIFRQPHTRLRVRDGAMAFSLRFFWEYAADSTRNNHAALHREGTRSQK